MKRLIILTWAFLSMLFRPTRWQMIHNVADHWEFECGNSYLHFRADRDNGAWFTFEIFHGDDPDMPGIRIFFGKWAWLLLCRWVDYRDEVNFAQIRAVEFWEDFKNMWRRKS